MIELLAISGSLRAQSSNTALLEAAAWLAPEGTHVTLYRELGEIPPFNPDLDDDLPITVRLFRGAVASCDGIIISSPEYAHGVAGVLKNALDWLVSGEEFSGKPVTLFNASPRAVIAQAQLEEILRVMNGRVVKEAFLSVPLLGRPPDAKTLTSDESISQLIRGSLNTFANAIKPAR